MIPGSLNTMMMGAGDPYWSNVSSLLHFDGSDASTTFTDETGKTWTANGDAQIDTAISKFGGASGLFDGTGDFIETPTVTDFVVGSGDFTVECFAYINSAGNGTVRDLYGKRTGAVFSNFIIYLDATNELSIALTTNGTSWTAFIQGSIPSTNTWLHIALVRSGTSLKTYIDGTVDISTTVSGSVVDLGGDPTIGASVDTSPSNTFYGQIDEFRFTKGIARYTATFTPPSAPFPNS